MLNVSTSLTYENACDKQYNTRTPVRKNARTQGRLKRRMIHKEENNTCTQRRTNTRTQGRINTRTQGKIKHPHTGENKTPVHRRKTTRTLGKNTRSQEKKHPYNGGRYADTHLVRLREISGKVRKEQHSKLLVCPLCPLLRVGGAKNLVLLVGHHAFFAKARNECLDDDRGVLEQLSAHANDRNLPIIFRELYLFLCKWVHLLLVLTMPGSYHNVQKTCVVYVLGKQTTKKLLQADSKQSKR